MLVGWSATIVAEGRAHFEAELAQPSLYIARGYDLSAKDRAVNWVNLVRVLAIFCLSIICGVVGFLLYCVNYRNLSSFPCVGHEKAVARDISCPLYLTMLRTR